MIDYEIVKYGSPNTLTDLIINYNINGNIKEGIY